MDAGSSFFYRYAGVRDKFHIRLKVEEMKGYWKNHRFLNFATLFRKHPNKNM
jgi:hypothetical protein